MVPGARQNGWIYHQPCQNPMAEYGSGWRERPDAQVLRDFSRGLEDQIFHLESRYGRRLLAMSCSRTAESVGMYGV